MKQLIPILAAGAFAIAVAATAPANAAMRGPDAINQSSIEQVDNRHWDGGYTNWKPRHYWKPRHHSRHSRYWRRHEPRFGFFFDDRPRRHHHYYYPWPRDSYYDRD
jgi:hypothetical protein